MSNLIKLKKNISLQELVSQKIFEEWGEFAIRFLDPRLPEIAQLLRTHFDEPIIVNDWYWGGPFNYRGFREPEYYDKQKRKKDRVIMSQHRFGRGLDFEIADIPSQEVQKEIKQHYGKFSPLITTMMDNTDGYTHVSCETTGLDTLNLITKKN